MAAAEDRGEQLLLEHADAFFADVKTEDELFGLLEMLHADLSRLFRGLNERGVLSLEDVGTYQWCASLIPAIIRTIKVGPKYDTPLLERQLRQNFRALLKGAPRVQAKKLT